MDENLEESLKNLVERQRLPKNGMEVHFLKVIIGTNLPCTKEEKQWYSWWQKYTESKKQDVNTRYTAQKNKKATLSPNQERVQKEKKAAIAMAAENGQKPQPIPPSEKELLKLKAKGPTNYSVDEGISGTREDNKKMRNQLWGDMVNRGRK